MKTGRAVAEAGSLLCRGLEIRELLPPASPAGCQPAIRRLSNLRLGYAPAVGRKFTTTRCFWNAHAEGVLPVRKVLLASSVTPETYRQAFGFAWMMDTLAAIVGPATALVLLPVVGHHYPTLFALTLNR